MEPQGHGTRCLSFIERAQGERSDVHRRARNRKAGGLVGVCSESAGADRIEGYDPASSPLWEQWHAAMGASWRRPNKSHRRHTSIAPFLPLVETGTSQKASLNSDTSCAYGGERLNYWRRGRDSNPRYGCAVHTLSRRAPSTTRTPLRDASSLERATLYQRSARRQSAPEYGRPSLPHRLRVRGAGGAGPAGG